MSFASTLKKLMFDRGIKAADLARATNLSEAAISDYLSGKKEPRGKQSIAIAKALGVSLDVLWEIDKNKAPVDFSDGRAMKIMRLMEKARNMTDEQLDALINLLGNLDNR